MIQEQNILEVIASCDIKIGNYSENCARLMRELKENTQLSPFTHLNIVVNRNEARQTATTRIRVIYPFKFSIDKGTNSSEDMLAVARSHADDIADVIGNVEAKLQMAFVVVNKQTQAVFDVNFSKQYFAQADKAQLLNTTIFAYISEYELICKIVDADVTIQPLPPYPPIPVKPTQHNTLMGLDYAHAGHTGFQKTLSSANAGNNITITFDADGNAVINAQVPSVAVWGNITGDIEDQTDLNNALTNIKNDVQTNANDISTIEGLIPSQATTLNQLADKAFVNSSIATATATFMGTVTATGDTEQEAQTALSAITGMDENDYAFVKVPNTPNTGVDKYKRYKYSNGAWLYEYTLNNSSFTANQWDAINSGITSGKVTTYDGYATSKQDTLTAGTNITIVGSTISASGGGGAPIAYPTIASNVLQTEMTLKSSISDNGHILTECGWVYNTSGSPTINDNILLADLGVGWFEKVLQGLTLNTTYHIRSYGINSQGTTYGAELTQKTVSNPIPAEYQLVEYIECSGTQYINLNIDYIAMSDFEFVAKNVQFNAPAGFYALFGYYVAATDELYLQSTTSNTVQYAFNNNRVTYSMSYNTLIASVAMKIANNVRYSYYEENLISTTAITYNSKNYPLYLFRLYGTASNYFKGRVGEIELTSNVNIHLYPVYRIADQVAGMYDIVNNVFYTNSGSGTFVVGPDKQWGE